MELAERWISLCRTLGVEADGDVEGVFRDLDACYREPGRGYHNWEHVRACLGELDGTRGACADPGALELALWFHDAIYDPKAGDNEERSSALLASAASELRLDPERAGRAERLVRATAPTYCGAENHAEGHAEGVGEDSDIKLIRDIDLAVLGSLPPDFSAYEAKIRQEHIFLPEDLYRRERAHFLLGLLKRRSIFATPAFQKRYEERARRNLQELVMHLSSHRQ